MDVNIYIETAFTGPAKRRTAGAWLVEYVSKKSGSPVTRGGILYTHMATETEMSLMLIKQAFSILTKTCCVRVFTHCQSILGAMQNHWLWQWQKDGWINSKGKPVKNAHMWEQCAELIGQHVIEWTEEEHSYRQCMLGRVQKEMYRDHEIKEEENYLAIPVPEWNTRLSYERNAEENRGKV